MHNQILNTTTSEKIGEEAITSFMNELTVAPVKKSLYEESGFGKILPFLGGSNAVLETVSSDDLVLPFGSIIIFT